MNRYLVGLAGLTGAAVLALGAPAVKPPAERRGPPTAEQFATTRANLKEIAIAWHSYHDTHNTFPTNQVNKAGKPLLSWRVQILPWIEQSELYKEFKLDEPWDSDHNRKLIDKMPPVYVPVRGTTEKGLTYYQTFTGLNGLIRSGQRRTFAAITDGTSNTLMVAEAAKPVIWTKPADLVFDGKTVPALGGMFDGQFHAAFCDGSVERLKRGLNADALRRLIDPQDGMVVNRKDVVEDSEGENKYGASRRRQAAGYVVKRMRHHPRADITRGLTSPAG